MSRFGLPGFRSLPARWRGLTAQLFLFVILPLTVLLVGLLLGSLNMHSQAMRDLVSERDRRAVQAAADSLTAQLLHRAAMVQTIAAQAAAAPLPGLDDYAFLEPFFEGGLAVYSPAGALLSNSTPSADWTARPVPEVLGPAAAPVFSRAFADPARGAYLVLVAAAAGPGQPVVVGAFAPSQPGRLAVSGLTTSDTPVGVWIVDPQGRVLFHAGNVQPEPELAAHPGVAEALRGETGATYLMVGDSEHVVAYSPVAPVGWALLVEEPWEVVDNPLLRQTLAAPLITIPVLLMGLVAMWFGIHQVVQPLQALERQAAEMGWGRFEAVQKPVGGIAEIRHLQAELARMAQKLHGAQQSLRDYLGAITRGQEDERRRLARGLHDGAVQTLIALDQRVQLAQLAVRKGQTDTPERLAEVRRMVSDLIEDIRRVIRALRPIYLEDLGLLPALEMLARDVEKTAGLQAHFTSLGTTVRLTPEQEIAAYRFAQEALSNVARHARATTVSVTAAFAERSFTLQVRDDGQGFAAPARVTDLATAGHYGLMGMQERAELVGARLSIQSAPGQGALVELSIPL